ncbi:unnamed protein product [Bursaphelenchus xylophilus]|uniref:(pine wood nematode) hypothetical protein n=1 Tax=Bursaphelenchus xylophilus TaxID=6326 RepID=A0A1I7SMH5_BURXY|nr:unnamed protein product [Bursaphelenchus xylophilus]CAG9130212.1 unnamed protein product [Bursaphelenchus xylophilus]
MSRSLALLFALFMAAVIMVHCAPIDSLPEMEKKSIYGLYQYIPKASGVKSKKFSSDPGPMIGQLPDGSYVIFGY